ncbi:TOPRIM nucleotidyl transferase/hydrolase domain-containing protein [Streptomyces sp. NPDC002889]|uniref:TOPRIM nucleotidyl transferase/hydrolase domain-containing protein n=1 Tax=Streptomyces sp. NPDC002889 TaxID=3364669 RepID=UPI00367D45D3
MEQMRRFRSSVVEWAAGRSGAPEAAAAAQELAARTGLRTVILVEGHSDQAAVEQLAARLGRDLDAECSPVVPLGGVTSIGRFLHVLGPQGLNVDVAGLCDAAEERFFQRGLERAGLGHDLGRVEMERRGFQVCVADLEDELIRALGADTVKEVVESQGEGRSFRTFQKQPVQRERSVEQQLHRFMGTHSGRKAQYARLLARHLDLGDVPGPLARLLAHVANCEAPAAG